MERVSRDHVDSIQTNEPSPRVAAAMVDHEDVLAIILRTSLEYTDDPAFKIITCCLDMKDLKSLRLTSRQLRRRVELHQKKILMLTIRGEDNLVKIMRELPNLQGRLKLELSFGYLSDKEISGLIKQADSMLLHLYLWHSDTFTGDRIPDLNIQLGHLKVGLYIFGSGSDLNRNSKKEYIR